jgi:hypothetical protein
MRTLQRALIAIVGLWFTTCVYGATDPLLYDLTHNTDNELAGKTPAQSLGIFSARNTTTGVYTRNVNLWTSLNLTGTTANNWGGVAISPRHVIYSAHASAGVGNEIHFVTADNVTIRRTITAMQTAPGYTPYWPDWRIALLNEALPPTITYARFLPDDWAAYLPAAIETHRIPTIGLNQFREATVQDLYSIATAGTNPMATTRAPIDTQRLAFYRNKISGDSSSPLLLDILGQPVVLAVWTFGGSGSGTSLTAQKTAINTVMANLGGGYQITEANLSIPPAVLPFTTDFESTEGYNLGGLRPGKGFLSTLDADVVTTAFSGTQGLSLMGPGSLTFSAQSWVPGPAPLVTWIDFYLKPVFADATFLPTEVNTALAAVTGFVKTGSLGEVYAVDGDGLGGGDWTASGYTAPVLDEQAVNWMRISYRIDYANKRWDLFIDGNLILADLGFADNAASPFTQLRLKGDSEKPAFLDYFYVGADNPLYADTSGTGLPDSWLLANGLNPSTAQRYGDDDHDGVDNLTEFRLGLLPNAPDTDNDGAFDRRELLWGTNPQLAEAHNLGAIPFSDGFETDATGAFATGTRSWQVQAGANAVVEVLDADAAQGAQALTMTGSDISLERRFADTTHAPVVWLDFYLKAALRSEAPETIPADVAAVFYFTPEGHIRVLDGAGTGGGEWRTFTVTGVVSEWNRVSLRMNYGTQRWSLWLNGVRLVDDLGFAHPVPYFSGFALHHSASQASALDAFLATHNEPAALDNDGDGLPNTWEVTYGLNPNDPADASISTSGDGWTNTEKFDLGVFPTTSYLTTLPFLETFEQLPAGNLAQGAHNWFFFGESTPQIQSQAHEGTQALLIPASEAGVRLVNRIDGSGQPVMWTQFVLKASPFPVDATPALSTETTAGLFFTQDGHLRVYDGPTIGWRTLSGVTVDLAGWHTVTLRHDYIAQTWSVWIDGVVAAENLGFAHYLTHYQKFEILGGDGVPTLLDTLRVQTTSTLLVDTTMPDWWRLQHFGTVDVDPALDPDGDGLTNLDEYLQGRIPKVADTTTGSASPVLYVNNTTGDDALYNGQSDAPDRPSTGFGPKASLAAALATAAADGRIIMSAGEAVYTESALPLTGKNVTLRPYGNVRITSPDL